MLIPRQVFAVRFRNLETYWEVRSVRIALTNRCHWPTELLSNLCSLRFEIVPERELATGQVQLLDRISFDEGKVFFGHRTQTKMTQYRAKSGDIAVSKINARKKAIGIVPDGVEVGLTIHFRALIPDISTVDTKYLWLALRSEYCRNQFDVETGGIGKGEISEERLLGVKVPLPPLEAQRAIVARWQAAQQSAREAEEQVKHIEASAEAQFFADLGLKPKDETVKQKVFVTRFKYLPHWNVRANQVVLQEHTLLDGKFPVVAGKDVLIEVKHGCSNPPSEKPTTLEILKISAVTKGVFDPFEKKYAHDNARVRRDFDLKKGDVLMCRTNGTLAYVGMSSLVDQNYENLIFPDKVIRVRGKDNILSEYLWLILQIYPVRLQIESSARTAVGNYAIGSDDIWNLHFPLPPRDIQEQIVNKVLSSRAEIARQKERAAQLRREAEAEVEALILGTKKIG
ncbi:MAG: restriction endonuclease subunit S [Chloroflexota bacterium]